ncbi:MAG TPA: site-2 protease family protein [Acidimicrobiales bacterium]|nr:site-2 protease family protein [Acidimicrobiales bacterium]
MRQAVLFGVLIPSVILHEISHGALALVFGDDTAQKAGRLTLNPIPHIDPLGTIIVPAIMAFTGFGAFGWAKPVPVRPHRLRSPRNHGLLVSLVGPAVNIAIALIAAFVLRFLRPEAAGLVLAQLEGDPLAAPGLLDQIVFYAGFVNVILAAFNLIPIPPLDGSAVIERLMPKRWFAGWLKMRNYSMAVLMVVVLMAGGLLSRLVFVPAIELWSRLLS